MSMTVKLTITQKKGGVVYTEIMLPEHAPNEYNDRNTLWNAVEKSCKADDERTAREVEIALPKELTTKEQIKLVQKYVKENFVDKGMCADIAIHSGRHEHPKGKEEFEQHDAAIKKDNPHAHILLTMRPIDKNGKWEGKTIKVYLCKNKHGDIKEFTANELRVQKAQNDEWEQRYQYQLGSEKAIYLTPSEANEEKYTNYRRVSRYPDSKRYGRENPTTKEWNDKKSLLQWRENWAKEINHELEVRGYSYRVSHESNKNRGMEETPTEHEGAAACAMEQRGIKSEKGNINREIRAFNEVKKLLNAEISKVEQQIAELKKQAANFDESGIARQLECLRAAFKSATVQVVSQEVYIENLIYSQYRQQALQIEDCVKMIQQQTDTINRFKAQKAVLGLLQGREKKILQQRISDFELNRQMQEEELKKLGVPDITQADQVIEKKTALANQERLKAQASLNDRKTKAAKAKREFINLAVSVPVSRQRAVQAEMMKIRLGDEQAKGYEAYQAEQAAKRELDTNLQQPTQGKAQTHGKKHIRIR